MSSSIAEAAEAITTRPPIKEIDGAPIGTMLEAGLVFRDRSQGRGDGLPSLTHSQMIANMRSINRFNKVPGATFKITMFEMGGAMPQNDVRHGRDALESFESVGRILDKDVGVRVLWRSLYGDGIDIFSYNDRISKLRRIATAVGAKNTEQGPGRLLLIRSFEANDDELDQQCTPEMIDTLRKEGFNIALEQASCYQRDAELDGDYTQGKLRGLLRNAARFPATFAAFCKKDMGGFQKPGLGAYVTGHIRNTTALFMNTLTAFGRETGFAPAVLAEHMHEIGPDRATDTMVDGTIAFLEGDHSFVKKYRPDFITGRGLGFGDLLTWHTKLLEKGYDSGMRPEQIAILRDEMGPQTRAWEDSYAADLPNLSAWTEGDFEQSDEPSGAAASTDRILEAALRKALIEREIPHHAEIAHRMAVKTKGWLRKMFGHHGNVTPGALNNDRVTRDYILGALAAGIAEEFCLQYAEGDWQVRADAFIAAAQERKAQLASFITDPKAILYFRGRLPKDVDPDFMDHICFMHLNKVLTPTLGDKGIITQGMPAGKFPTPEAAALAYEKARAKILAQPADKANAEATLRALGLDGHTILAIRKEHVGRIEIKRDQGVPDKEKLVRAQILSRTELPDGHKLKITLRMPLENAVHNAMLFGLDEFGNISSAAAQVMQYPAKQFPFHWVNPAQSARGYSGVIDRDGRTDKECACIDAILAVIQKTQRPIRSLADLQAADSKMAEKLMRQYPCALHSLGLSDKPVTWATAATPVGQTTRPPAHAWNGHAAPK